MTITETIQQWEEWKHYSELRPSPELIAGIDDLLSTAVQRERHMKEMRDALEKCDGVHPSKWWIQLRNKALQPTAASELKCSACGGDGKETCDNPDHGLIVATGGETWRLGCPCCGHDPEHKTGHPCPECNGSGTKPHSAREPAQEVGALAQTPGSARWKVRFKCKGGGYHPVWFGEHEGPAILRGAIEMAANEYLRDQKGWLKGIDAIEADVKPNNQA